MNSEQTAGGRKNSLLGLLGITFALSAMGICIHSQFYAMDTAVKTQAIYWFGISMTAAFVPYLKDLAVYIRRIKVGEVEIELTELKKELGNVKNEVLKMDQRLHAALERVRQSESSLSEPMKQFRATVFDDFASKLSAQPADKRLAGQSFFTLRHLAAAGIGVSELKNMLRDLKYYQGSIDDFFTPELALAIEHFQMDHTSDKPDGIAGPITLNAMREALADSTLHQG